MKKLDFSKTAKKLVRVRPVASDEVFLLHVDFCVAESLGVLIVSVPKRYLARAVDRNLVRRVALESWRFSGLASLGVPFLLRVRSTPKGFFRTKGEAIVFRASLRCKNHSNTKAKAFKAPLFSCKDTLLSDSDSNSSCRYTRSDLKKTIRSCLDGIFLRTLEKVNE